MNIIRSKKGFTLFECLIAILILGIFSGAMIGTFMVGKLSVVRAKHHTQAINHARAAIESIISGSTFTLPSGDIKTMGGSYTQNITGVGTGIKTIKVIISWNEQLMGATKNVSVELMTYISE